MHLVYSFPYEYFRCSTILILVSWSIASFKVNSPLQRAIQQAKRAIQQTMRAIQHFQNLFEVEMPSKEGYSTQGKKSEGVSTLSVHDHSSLSFARMSSNCLCR